MATLPLYIPTPTRRDGWHHVTAPGGYEWWHFDGESDTGDLQVVATFYDGFPLHPQYLRRHTAYRRRPTRRPPPVPADYPCVQVAVYEHGVPIARSTCQFPAGALQPGPDGHGLAIGPNTLRIDQDGTGYRLQAHVSESAAGLPRARRETAATLVNVDLTFTSPAPAVPTEYPLLPADANAARHRWLVPAPRCEVHGTIRLGPPGRGAATDRVIDFRGRGYHDHHYGAGPLAADLRRWVRGRVLTRRRTCAFRAAERADREGGGWVSQVVEADRAGQSVRPGATVPTNGWERSLRSAPAYPIRLDLGGGLSLHTPQILEASPASLRLIYAADVGAERGRALCDVIDPRRLRWPVVGRLIERSIESCG